MIKPPRKHPFMIGLDMDDDEQERVRKFAGLTEEKSVRRFVLSAIRNEINARLKVLTPDERAAIETAIS